DGAHEFGRARPGQRRVKRDVPDDETLIAQPGQHARAIVPKAIRPLEPALGRRRHLRCRQELLELLVRWTEVPPWERHSLARSAFAGVRLTVARATVHVDAAGVLREEL